MCGNLNLIRDRPSEAELLFRLAYAKGIRGDRIPTGSRFPVVTGPEACVVASWLWPVPDGQPLFHCRSETGAVLPTWRDAWEKRRGVIAIDGWHEGDRQVDAPGSWLAVVWTDISDDAPELRFAVVTVDPPAGSQVPRYPVPLHQEGAIAWLDRGDLSGRAAGLREYGQETLFG